MSVSGLTHPHPVSPSLTRAWLTPLELGGLAAVWGASFMFMRIAAPAFGPLPLVELRLALGALVLMPFLWRARSSFGPGLWPKLALVGVLNSAIPFALFAWAARRAPAGVGAITNSMAVLFTALVAFLFYGERIGVKRAVALLTGFVGVVVLASGKAAGESIAWAAAAGTLAAFLYGIGANMVRRQLTGLPAAAVAAATLSCSALLMLPFAVATWPAEPIGARPWLAAASLGIVCTGFAYAVYYRLIQRIGAARAVSVTYLVPLFAVAWAWLLLDEPLTPSMLIAGTLILGSVALGQPPAARKAT
ncbi:EamA family transporter [Corallococcus sp. bb12-1]|uniref:DMT family transporter n=1 Tax=Corallococcus sp. bb12-1 TaxID=2996784 RepID=UPI00226F3548|nr:EamA family transporter [Corallococcus sp. bb12-1]MCY1041497.1 EamA family transporter [Corallococcus sp. bb12-1]